MQNIGLLIILLCIYSSKSIAQNYPKIKLLINGKERQDSLVVDEINPLILKLDFLDYRDTLEFSLDTLNFIHFRENRALGITTFSSNFLGNEIKVFPSSQVQKNDSIMIEIIFTELKNYTKNKAIYKYKISDFTIKSIPRPYFLEIDFFENDQKIESFRNKIKIESNYKVLATHDTKDQTYYLKYRKGQNPIYHIEGNRYYFDDLGDSLAIKIEHLGNEVYFYFSNTKEIKYGGILQIGVITNRKKLLKKHKNIIKERSKVQSKERVIDKEMPFIYHLIHSFDNYYLNYQKKPYNRFKMNSNSKWKYIPK